MEVLWPGPIVCRVWTHNVGLAREDGKQLESAPVHTFVNVLHIRYQMIGLVVFTIA
jgi:hypothetical protein